MEEVDPRNSLAGLYDPGIFVTEASVGAFCILTRIKWATSILKTAEKAIILWTLQNQVCTPSVWRCGIYNLLVMGVINWLVGQIGRTVHCVWSIVSRVLVYSSHVQWCMTVTVHCTAQHCHCSASSTPLTLINNPITLTLTLTLTCIVQLSLCYFFREKLP